MFFYTSIASTKFIPRELQFPSSERSSWNSQTYHPMKTNGQHVIFTKVQYCRISCQHPKKIHRKENFPFPSFVRYCVCVLLNTTTESCDMLVSFDALSPSTNLPISDTMVIIRDLFSWDHYL